MIYASVRIVIMYIGVTLCAMFAATMYLSVHPSVLLSATICYCVETAELIVDTHLLRDSPINMVFVTDRCYEFPTDHH